MSLQVVLVGFLCGCQPKPVAPPVIEPADLATLERAVQASIMEAIRNVQASPLDPEKRSQLGLVYAGNRLWDEAGRCFAQAVELLPDAVLPRYYVGVAEWELGDTTKALKTFEQVVELHPGFAPAHHSLGELLLETGANTVAEALFQRVIELAPTDPNGYVGLSDVRLREGDASGARETIERAVKLDPQHRKARYILGLVYRQVGRHDEARAHLALGQGARREYMTDPWRVNLPYHDKSVQGRIRLARAYGEAGKIPEAIQLLEQALVWSPEAVQLLTNLGFLYRLAGDPKRALALLERAEKMKPNTFEIHLNFAFCYDALSKADQAVRYARSAARLGPTRPHGQFTAGRILAKAGHEREALVLLQRAVESAPTNSNYQLGLGNVHMLLREPEHAVAPYRAAADLAPQWLTAKIRLCLALIAREDWVAARTVLEQARTIDPTADDVAKLDRKLQALGY